MSELQTSAAEYTPRVVLITGGAGFIGSHVVQRLVREHPAMHVVNLDKLDYCASAKNLVELADAPNYTFVEGDVRNLDLVRMLMRTHRVDTVMHFAAQSHVDNSFSNSMSFTSNNVVGTHVMLEAARQCSVQRFVLVSSDEVYGQTGVKTVDENAPLLPTQPYSATKAAAEMIARAYYLSFGLPLIITRGNNVYGPQQYPEKIIPKFVRLLLAGRRVPLHGSGQSRRSFVYATDAARAFDLILHRGAPGEVYNMGVESELTMREVAVDLCKRFGRDPDEAIEHVDDRAFNDDRYSINSAKLQELGWAPKVAWAEGIARTVDWYRAHPNHWPNEEVALAAHPKVAPGSS